MSYRQIDLVSCPDQKGCSSFLGMATTGSQDGNAATKKNFSDLMTSRSLPQELVVEILSWVPIKYLCPFRYVSKTWLQLLTRDPLFAKLHFDRSIQSESSPSIVVKSNELRLYYIATDNAIPIPLELPFQQNSFCFVVNGICNGLLCLSSMGKAEVNIWNPITNDHITIPYSPAPSRFPGFHKNTQIMFGFHQGTNEYKVIKISCECDYKASQFHSEASVYTLGINSSWRTVVDDIQYNMLSRSTDCPLVNGSIHMLSTRTGSLSHSAIVAFDLKDESFQEIPPPKDINFAVSFLSKYLIGELGGQLCMLCGRGRKDVQIWVMKEYGVANSWSKLIKIGIPEMGGIFTYMDPLCIVAHSGYIILKKNMTDLILYHPKTNSITCLGNFGFEIYEAYTYIGSIISPRLLVERSIPGHNGNQEKKVKAYRSNLENQWKERTAVG